MEHTVSYLERDVERERRRGDFLEAAVRTYAPHVWNDIKATLAAQYPRAIHYPPLTND